MSFTDAEKTDIRRFCGYSMFGDQSIPNMGARFVTQYGALEFRLIHMQPTEEVVVRTVYLDNLRLLESDIVSQNARENIDTLKAAVWSWNPNEMRDRERLFRNWRMKLCQFLNVEYGPAISGSANQVSISI